MMRRSLMRLMGLLVVACAATVSLQINSQPASSGGVFLVTQHNILGNFYSVLYADAFNNRPQTLTAQEVCDSTRVRLSSGLGELGYGGLAITGLTSPLCNNAPVFSMALTQAAVPGTGRGGKIIDSRNRVWACYVGQYGLRWRVCTFHSTAAEAPDFEKPHQESLAMFYLLTPGSRTEATVVGADMNIRPRQFAPQDTTHWRPDWMEGDDVCYGRNMDRTTFAASSPYYERCPTQGSLRLIKIDYTWADRQHFDYYNGLAHIYLRGGSDHYLYRASYLIP